MDKTDCVCRKSWQEFRDTGLFWLMNSVLHTFGWSLVVDVDDTTGEIVSAYPARVTFRGFNEASNSEGYIKVANYMKENAEAIAAEAAE